METPQQLFLNIRNSLQGVVNAMGQLYGPSVSHSVYHCLANAELYLGRVETLVTENARKTDMNEAAEQPAPLTHTLRGYALVARRGEFTAQDRQTLAATLEEAAAMLERWIERPHQDSGGRANEGQPTQTVTMPLREFERMVRHAAELDATYRVVGLKP